jgi:hypothetical protein
MKFSIAALALGTAYADPLSAAEYKFDIVATSQQTSRFSDGREAVDDAGATTIVRILEPRTISKDGDFLVLVANNSDRPLNFGPESIVIRLADGSAVAMFTYDDLMRQQKRREGRQRFAMALSAAGRSMQANQAGYNYGTTTYSGSASGSVGTTPFRAQTYGTGTYSGYNASAATAARLAADAQTQRDVEAMRRNQATQRAAATSVMKMTTVDPGGAFGGIVQFRVSAAMKPRKKTVRVTIEVMAGNEVHSFPAMISKAR